jgi:hypothetical protein
MSGYRSKRVANTRTAMGTTDQRPTGSGAVMLGLTGSGPGSSPWTRRAAQRRGYTSMLQKKCAEGNKASCINPVAAVTADANAACASTGILVNPGNIDITWSFGTKVPFAGEYYIKASIRFKNNCGPVNISSPEDSSSGTIVTQFKLSGTIVGVGPESGNVTFTNTSPNYMGGEGNTVIYDIIGSGEGKGKIELYWIDSVDGIISNIPASASGLTLTYAKDNVVLANLKATDEYVPPFTDTNSNAFNTVVSVVS